MFGLLKSVVSLAVDVVEVAAKPVEMVADLAGAALQPVKEVARELSQDFKSLKD